MGSSRVRAGSFHGALCTSIILTRIPRAVALRNVSNIFASTWCNLLSDLVVLTRTPVFSVYNFALFPCPHTIKASYNIKLIS